MERRLELTTPEQTLPTMLERSAVLYGERPLLRFVEAVWSYGEVREDMARLAGALVEAGIAAGDRVVAVSENRPEVLRLWLACGWLGAVLVPVSTALRGDGLRHVLASARPTAVALESALRERVAGGDRGDLGARRGRPPVTYLLGPMVSILLRTPEGEHDRAHRGQVALAPATPAALHEPFFERFGVRLIDAWGSTETNIVLSNTLADLGPGTLGRVLDGFEARVADEHDAELPDGIPRELLVRHRDPWAFASGYDGFPEATVAAWRNLWFHTGDRVIRDPDGRFRFVDRLKDVIRGAARTSRRTRSSRRRSHTRTSPRRQSSRCRRSSARTRCSPASSCATARSSTPSR